MQDKPLIMSKKKIDLM